MFIVLLLLFSSFLPAAEVTMTASPMSYKVMRDAYGKLPPDVIAWSITVQGPNEITAAREILVAAGYPVVKNSIIEGLSLRGSRLSLLKIVPEVIEYGAWVGSFYQESTGAAIALPLSGMVVSRLLSYIPRQAAEEKRARLSNDLCDYTITPRAGTVYECVIFTLKVVNKTPEPIFTYQTGEKQ